MDPLKEASEVENAGKNHIENKTGEKLEVFVRAFTKNFEHDLEEYIKAASIDEFPSASVLEGHFNGRNRREKANKIKQIFQTVTKGERRKMLVEAATLIYYSFQSQMESVTDADGNWKRGLSKMAVDACDRSFSYIYNKEMSLEIEPHSTDLLTKAVILGKSKCSIMSYVFPNQTRSKLKNKTNVTRWKTSEIFDKIGIKMVTSNGQTKYYNKKMCDKDYGYRWCFSWENDHSWISNYEEEDCPNVSQGTPTFPTRDELEVKMDQILETNLDRIGDEVDEMLKTLRTSQSNLNEIQPIALSHEVTPEKGKIFNVMKPVKTFTGRDHQLAALHSKLQVQQKQVISGLGGVGKSELARKYAWTNREFYNSNLIWIDCETISSTIDSFHKVADLLQIPKTHSSPDGNKSMEKDLLSIINEIYKHFSNSKSLFIFDNVNQFEDIKNFLPSNPPELIFDSATKYETPTIIITSRNRDFNIGDQNDISLTQLDPFTLEEALSFVREVLEIDDKDKSHDTSISELTKEICCFPVALRQAASCIKANKCLNSRVENYLVEFRDEKKKTDLLKYKTKHDRYRETTYTTWKITFRSIEKNEANGLLAIRLVEIMAYLKADDIPVKAFTKLAVDEGDLKKAVDVLVKYTIIAVKKNVIYIHGLVQQMIRLRLRERKEEEEVLRTALTHVQDYLNVNHKAALWSYACEYLTLIDEFFCNTPKETESFEKSVLVFNYLTKDGNARSVKKLLDRLEHKNDLWQELISTILNTSKYRIKCNHDGYDMPNIGHEMHVKDIYIFHAQVYNALNQTNSKELKLFLQIFDKSLINSWFDGYTALHNSAKAGKLNVVKILIQNGADINFLNFRVKDPALHVAIRSKQPEVAEYLLDQRALSNIANVFGRKAIHYAAEFGYVNIVERLAGTKEERDSRTEHGQTALHFAAENDHVDIVKLLISYKDDLNRVKEERQTVGHIAAANASYRVVRYLINNRLVDVNLPGMKNETLLSTAVKYNQLDMVKWLIYWYSTDINAFNVWGATPLFLAVLNNHIDIATFLVERWNFVANVQNGNTLLGRLNVSALHLAAAWDCREIVTMLINKGSADINMGLNETFSPLQVAKYFGNTSVSELLIENGADTSEWCEGNFTNIIRIFRILYRDTNEYDAINDIIEICERILDSMKLQRGNSKNLQDRLELVYARLQVIREQARQ